MAYPGQGFRIKRKFEDHVGVQRALEPNSCKIIWEAKETLPLWSDTFAIKGNRVFTGICDGCLKAFDAKNGKERRKRSHEAACGAATAAGACHDRPERRCKQH